MFAAELTFGWQRSYIQQWNSCMLWISELFLWVIFLCVEPWWHIFLDYELNDFIIDPREAAIASVGEKNSVCTQISSFQRPSIAFRHNIDRTKWMKWILNILCTVRQNIACVSLRTSLCSLVVSDDQNLYVFLPINFSLQT